MYAYPALFTREGNAIVVTVPDIPEVITNGYSEQQAMDYTIDAMETVLAEYIRRGLRIPAPSRPQRKTRLVSLPALTQAKLSLYMALRSVGIRQGELARRLGWHKSQVERLLDLQHASRMDQIEAAFQALGKRLEVAVRDAA